MDSSPIPAVPLDGAEVEMPKDASQGAGASPLSEKFSSTAETGGLELTPQLVLALQGYMRQLRLLAGEGAPPPPAELSVILTPQVGSSDSAGGKSLGHVFAVAKMINKLQKSSAAGSPLPLPGATPKATVTKRSTGKAWGSKDDWAPMSTGGAPEPEAEGDGEKISQRMWAVQKLSEGGVMLSRSQIGSEPGSISGRASLKVSASGRQMLREMNSTETIESGDNLAESTSACIASAAITPEEGPLIEESETAGEGEVATVIAAEEEVRESELPSAPESSEEASAMAAPAVGDAADVTGAEVGVSPEEEPSQAAELQEQEVQGEVEEEAEEEEEEEEEEEPPTEEDESHDDDAAERSSSQLISTEFYSEATGTAGESEASPVQTVLTEAASAVSEGGMPPMAAVANLQGAGKELKAVSEGGAVPTAPPSEVYVRKLGSEYKESQGTLEKGLAGVKALPAPAPPNYVALVELEKLAADYEAWRKDFRDKLSTARDVLVKISRERMKSGSSSAPGEEPVASTKKKSGLLGMFKKDKDKDKDRAHSSSKS